MLTTFGKFTRKLRIDNDELLKDMAEKLGVSPSYLSAVEHGKRNIPAHWQACLAEHYVLNENQMPDFAYAAVIAQLSKREIKAVKAALAVIHLGDNSDYINGLWDVLRALLGSDVIDNDDEFSVDEWVQQLNIFED